MFDQMKQLYAAMERRAEDGMFVGSTVEVFRNALPTASSSAYVRLFDLLEVAGFAQRLERGNRYKPSTVKLIKTPSWDEFKSLDASKIDLTKPPSSATLANRLSLVERRLPSIDLPRYIENLEGRFSLLESRVKELEGRDSSEST